MSKKVFVKSVFLKRDVLLLSYRTALQLQGIGGDDRKAMRRFIQAVEAHPKFDKDVEEGACPECGNLRLIFRLDPGEEGIYIKVRREDRKPLYDHLVEKAMKRNPPIVLERQLIELARALGRAKDFEDLAVVRDSSIEEEEEIEEVEETEDADSETDKAA